MPNIGLPELLIIAVVVMVLFGFKKLPEAARSIGKSARVFKAEVNEYQEEDRVYKERSEASQTAVSKPRVTDESFTR